MKEYTTFRPLTIDDLPGPRCAEAMAMLAYMRRQRCEFFVAGSKSAAVAHDLALCGYLRLCVDSREGPYTVLRAHWIGGAR